MDADDTRHNNTMGDGVPNDGNGVSDVSSQRELLAVGGETEDQPSNTLEDGSKSQEAPNSTQQPSQFHERSNCETCNCTKGTGVAHVNGVTCPICDKVINLVVEESGQTTFTCGTESDLSHILATGMPMGSLTPELSSGDQSAKSCEPEYQRTVRAVGEDACKIPIEGDSEMSVQMPCTPCDVTLFILQQNYPQTNEQQISIYFAENMGQTRIPLWIKQMEQNQGIKLVSSGDEHSSQQENKHFHHLCLEGGITVKFELVKQIHRKFRIRNHQAIHEVPLHRIKSLCQHRIPGATLQVRIESLCEPGEVCQDHLRMTMENGQTIHKFLIPIWSSGQS